jgi:hypothetical protein
MGGFKDKGPHNIGYYLRTANSDGAKQKEDTAPCYRFVATLQARMLAGMDRKNRGLDHEVIQVIAQEGEKIVVREWKTEAKDGGNKSKNYKMVGSIVELTVPKFLRPGENPGVTYDNKLDARAARRDQAALALEDMLADQAANQDARFSVAVGSDTIVDDAAMPSLAGPDPAVPLAEPARKGK